TTPAAPIRKGTFSCCRGHPSLKRRGLSSRSTLTAILFTSVTQRSSVVLLPIVIVSARSSSFIPLLGYATTLTVTPTLRLSSDRSRNSIRGGGARTMVRSFLSASTLIDGGLPR